MYLSQIEKRILQNNFIEIKHENTLKYIAIIFD